MVFSREHFILKAEVEVFCFWWKIQLFSNYLKTNNICITVDNFFHDSLFSVLPVECPRRAVAIELPGGIFITQHIVTHNCEWSWKERKKERERLSTSEDYKRWTYPSQNTESYMVYSGGPTEHKSVGLFHWAFHSRRKKRPCWASSYHVRLNSSWKKISVTTTTRRHHVRNKAMQSHFAVNSLLPLRMGEI